MSFDHLIECIKTRLTSSVQALIKIIDSRTWCSATWSLSPLILVAGRRMDVFLPAGGCSPISIPGPVCVCWLVYDPSRQMRVRVTARWRRLSWYAREALRPSIRVLLSARRVTGLIFKWKLKIIYDNAVS